MALLALPIISSIARGLAGLRRNSPDFCRLARCACTVEEDASPTALPISRTVGGYPYFDAYRWMKSNISCWRFVSFSSTKGLGPPGTCRSAWTGRTHVRRVAGPQDV